ncbi:MAG: hypothetical protein U0871_22665 [Gemmataceae bacterium]
MPFDTRCPECQAKLTLDAAPAPGTPVECPRCGSTFVPPRKKKKDKPAAGDAKPKPPGVPKKKKAKKKKTNPVILLLAIGLGFVGLIGVGGLMFYFLNKSGKVEEMLAQVPADFNWARGVNVGQLAKYPGYGLEVEKYNTAEVKAGVGHLAKSLNRDPDSFLDYLIISRNKPDRGAGGQVYVLRTMKSFAPAKMVEETGALPGPGGVGYKLPGAAGILDGAVVFFPSPRLVVVVPAGAAQADTARGVAAAGADKKASFAASLNDTGRVVARGSIWLLVRATGGLKTYPGALVAGVDQDFKKLVDSAKTAPAFGMWTTPGGGGVRFGAALECGSSKDAADLVTYFKTGPLGKGDESEPTNQLKSALAGVSEKKLWSEMMQQMDYRSKGACAYLVTTLTEDRAKGMMGTFNNPNLATDSTSFSGQGGQPPGRAGLAGAGGPGG